MWFHYAKDGHDTVGQLEAAEAGATAAAVGTEAETEAATAGQTIDYYFQ